MKVILVFIMVFTVLVHADESKEASVTVHSVLVAKSSQGDTNINISKDIAHIVNYSDGISSYVYSPDGKYLVAGNTNGIVNIWDAVSGELLSRFTAHSEHVSAITFHPDSKQFATGSTSSDGTIKTWDSKTKEQLTTIGKQADENNYFESSIGILNLKYTHDGSKIVATVRENSGKVRIEVYDIKSGKTLQTFDQGEVSPKLVSVSPNGKEIIIANGDEIIFKSLLSNKETRTITADRSFNELFFSPDGKYLSAFSFYQGCSQIWDTKTMKKINLESNKFSEFIKEHEIDCLNRTQQEFLQYIKEKYDDEPDSIIFSPDGKYFVDSSYVYDDYIEIWDVETKKKINTLTFFSTGISNLEFSPDGKTLAVAQYNSRVAFWDIENNQLKENITLASKTATNNIVQNISYSADGKNLFSFIFRDRILHLDLENKKIQSILGDDMELLALMPNRTVIAYIDSGCRSKIPYCLHIWDYNNKTMLFEFDFSSEYSYDSMSFSSDGTMLAVSTNDEVLRVWNTQTWKQTKLISTGNKWADRYTSLQFSPDKKFLAGARGGHGIEIRKIEGSFWSNIAWEIIKDIDGSSFHYSPDGKSLAIGSHTKDTISIWNTNTWKKEQTIQLGENLATVTLKYSPDSKLIGVALDYGIVRLINATTGENIVDLISGPNGHWFKQTPDGKFWHSGSKQMIARDQMKN